MWLDPYRDIYLCLYLFIWIHPAHLGKLGKEKYWILLEPKRSISSTYQLTGSFLGWEVYWSTWRIIPFSKWLGSPASTSHVGHLEGEQPYLGDLLTMVINHLLTGMILQVPPWKQNKSPLKNDGTGTRSFLFGKVNFQGQTVQLREIHIHRSPCIPRRGGPWWNVKG